MNPYEPLNDTVIDWLVVEEKWLTAGKEPRLDLPFMYALDNPRSIGSCRQMADKRSRSSAAQCILLERTTQRNADCDSLGQAPIWATYTVLCVVKDYCIERGF